ncbi:MAG: PAS domain S-box protein [Zavarzinia sp.]|nr:PAS domain S-box protein [Zavarzinia sp.]
MRGIPHSPLNAISPRLRHRLKEIETLLAREGDAIMVCEAGDLDTPFPRIVDANAAQARLTGHDVSALLGQTPRLFQGPETDPATRAEIRAALSERRKIHAEIQNHTKDGERYWIELDIAPVIDPDSGRLFFISFQRDITRRKRLEHELAEANARAARASAGRDDLLAAVANDLRAPLGMISANLELLTKGLLSPAQQPLVEAAEAAAHNLGAQIGDMIEFARLDSTAALPGPALPLILQDFVHALRRSVAGEAARRHLHIETAIGPGVPDVPRFDIPRLRQLLGHLLAHALRHTDDGGIALVVERAGPNLRFTVHDSGTGALPGDAQRLLAGLGARGIGLAIASRLATVLQTRLEIDTAPGSGTSIWFDLSLGPSADTDTPLPATLPAEWRRALRAGARGQDAMPPPEAVASGNLSQLRVLVVDNDPMRRATLARQIQSLGPKVDIVGDGRMALVIATAETRYDVILLRFDLPGMGVPEIARALRANEAEHGLPPGRILVLCPTPDIAQGDPCSDAAGIDDALPDSPDLSALAEALTTSGSARTETQAPALDKDALKTRLGIAEDIELAPFLAVFAEELDELQAALEQAASGHAADTARDLLHTLAGKARASAAEPLAEATTPCLNAIEAGDWVYAARALIRLTREADRLRASFDEILSVF